MELRERKCARDANVEVLWAPEILSNPLIAYVLLQCTRGLPSYARGFMKPQRFSWVINILIDMKKNAY